LRSARPATRIVREAAAPRAGNAAQTPHALLDPWIVDGDTLDDRATGIRYRLENIDAPETDDRAACAAERYMGNRAKWEAVNIVRTARTVIAAPTGKIDAYGRIVAHIKVDGQDMGELMIANGLALPWNGQRESWCGYNGNLHALAMTHFKRPICRTCAVRRNAG
jgi:micrococcal nuclease